MNGDRREVAEGSTVSTLLEELGLHPRGVAVEYNGEILKRAPLSRTRVSPTETGSRSSASCKEDARDRP